MLTDFPLDDATAVVATVGTTNTTSVDPVRELAGRCAEAGVWLHVDAAYAGSACVCPEFRWCFDGVELADSVVVNPHKWLFTPVDCSTLWTRRPEALRAAFSARADYMAGTEGVVDFRNYTPVLGRRFRALKLWAVLRCFGARGPAGADPRARAPGGALRGVGAAPSPAGRSRRRGSSRPSASATSRPTTTRSSARANEGGRIFIAPTKLRGETVLRLAIGNGLDERGRRPDRVGGAARVRAVIFDLWDTLVDWPLAESMQLRDRIAAVLGLPDEEFAERWHAMLPRLPDRAARRRVSRARHPGARAGRSRGRAGARSAETASALAPARRGRSPSSAAAASSSP